MTSPGASAVATSSEDASFLRVRHWRNSPGPSNTDLPSRDLVKPAFADGPGTILRTLSQSSTSVSAGTSALEPHYGKDLRVKSPILVAESLTVQINAHEGDGNVYITELTSTLVVGSLAVRDP